MVIKGDTRSLDYSSFKLLLAGRGTGIYKGLYWGYIGVYMGCILGFI